MTFELFLRLLVAGGVVFLAYHVLLYVKTGVPIVCLQKKYLKYLMSEIKIDSDSVVYELGSGKGDFAFAVADLEPNRVVGYELSLMHVAYCRAKARATRSRVEFYMRNFFDEDLSDADIVYFWLVPKIAERAWKKIQSECKPGTLVVQFGTKLSGIEPERSVKAYEGDKKTARFWFYRV